MRVKIDEQTINTLKNLKGLWLLDHNNRIILIKDYETETVTETPEPRMKMFGKVKTYKPVDNIYLTKFVLKGFNTDLKFIGTSDDNYAEKLIKFHMQRETTIDLIEFRKRWLYILEQKDAFLEYEKKNSVTKSEDSSISKENIIKYCELLTEFMSELTTSDIELMKQYKYEEVIESVKRNL